MLFERLQTFLVVVLCFVTAIQAMAVDNCAIVGMGVLGTHLCRQILQASPTSQVTGITATERNHASIRLALGSNDGRLQLLTSKDDTTDKFDNVVFCAPPSGFDDYPAAVKQAVEKYWAGSEAGVFVFTSSAAVYGQGNGGTVTEDSPVADDINSPRVNRLLQAEQACLRAGGCALRLAGLYTLERGAHNYWLTVGKPIPSPPNGIVNQVHYEDAASSCFAALRSQARNQVFLISDGSPQTRTEICRSALQASIYQNCSLPKFTGDGSVNGGKVLDGAASNIALGWKPKYPSFDDFMKSKA